MRSWGRRRRCRGVVAAFAPFPPQSGGVETSEAHCQGAGVGRGTPIAVVQRVMTIASAFALRASAVAVRRVSVELFGRPFRKDGEIFRPLTILGFTEALGCDAALEQFSNSRRSAGHAFSKAPGVNQPKLVLRKHYLKPLIPAESAHVLTPEKSTDTAKHSSELLTH
jgi:hypothetical protein